MSSISVPTQEKDLNPFIKIKENLLNKRPEYLNIDHPEDLFSSEVNEYLSQYPLTRHIDICLHDLNGHVRGKQIDVQSLKKIYKGCYFPLSVYAMDLDGKVVEETGLGKSIGEPDMLCTPISGTLQPCAIQPETHAQLYLTMQDENGEACKYEPRNLLSHIIAQLHQQDYYPVMSAELEFYLYKQNADGEDEVLSSQCFDLNTPDDYQYVLEEVEQIARLQSIEMIGIVAEAASGQYEINIQHTSNILRLCDQIMALKRIIKQVARKHQLHASFLAKPTLLKAGSGMHFHMSLCNASMQNLFSSNDLSTPSKMLLKTISGMIQLMPASMAILAPNINSYRRFTLGHHVSLEANWGINNRNVAIRIPCSDQENQRLEYRVAGADCNPYLAIAVILIATLHGLEHQLDTPQPVHLVKSKHEHINLPKYQLEALNLLKNNPVLKKYLGKEFIEVWCTVKSAEYYNVYNQITETEQNWDI